MATLKEERIKQSAIVLANAGELVSHVVRDIVGNDISSTLNGSRVTMNMLRSITQSRLKRHFNTVK